MDELIPLLVDDTGERLVDLKNVHEFLGVKSPFRDWVKRRIKQYDFSLDEDFRAKVRENLPGKLGRSEIDYYATIQMAKELCMIENNERGKMARKYFLEVEAAFKRKQNPQLETPAEALLQSVTLIVEQEKRIKRLEEKNEQREQEAREARRQLLELQGADIELKKESKRVLLLERINFYVASNDKGLKWQDVWKMLYAKAVYRLGIHFNKEEKKLDQVERKGKMDMLYALACEMFPLKETDYDQYLDQIPPEEF